MSDEVLTSYSGVKLSQDEANTLMGIEPTQPVEQTNTGEEQPQEIEVLEKDQSIPESEPQEDSQEIDVLELNGEEYDLDTIQEALEAYQNKSDWQKSNTAKSQEISAERKALKAEQKAWSDIRKNEDAMEALKDILDDDHPLFSDTVSEAEEEPIQDTKNSDARIQELEERLNELTKVAEQERLDIEADKQVHADLNKLKQSHPELEDQEMMDKVINTAIEKGFTGINGLEDAFVLTYHTASEDSAFKTAVNRARSAKAMKSIPETEGTVKGQHTEPITKAESYKDARQDALKNYNFYE